MNESEWSRIEADLRNGTDLDLMVGAAERLHRAASSEDVGRLRELLADDDFFVREAAAWPLSELAGVSHLPALLHALRRGIEEGHDNDGLTAALVDLAESEPAAVRTALEALIDSPRSDVQEEARWLMQFCHPVQDA